jgi:hypothetical protein
VSAPTRCPSIENSTGNTALHSGATMTKKTIRE